MGMALKTGAVALAALMTASSALARTSHPSAKCAKTEEISAIQAAAVQQQLMVAALTCNEISRFNSFQTSFGPELRKFDATLNRMFRRLYGVRQGEAEYHAFKTRLANDSSIRSIHDNVNYCREAGSLLTTALAPAKPSLVTFVAVMQVVQESPVDSCQLRVATNFGEIPTVIPMPKPQLAATLTSGTAPPQ